MQPITIYISCMIILLFAVIVSFSTWNRTRNSVQGTGLWTAGYVLFSLSVTFHQFSPYLTETVHQVGEYFCEWLGAIFMYCGFYYCCGIRKKPVIIFIAVLTGILYAHGLYFYNSVYPNIYILFESIANCIITLAVISAVITLKKKSFMKTPVFWLFAFMSVLFVSQAVASSSIALETEELTLQWTYFGPISWITIISITVFSQHQLINNILNGKLRQNLAEVITYKENLLETKKILFNANRDIIAIFADILDTRLSETSGHVKRVSEITRVILEKMQYAGDDREIIINSAALHDIGKIGIPDFILQKQGIYSPEEKKIMEKHTLIGYEILSPSNSVFFKTAATISLEHHEHWDGTGYPLRKKDMEISFPSRVVAVADTFDALVHSRSYKPAWSFEEAMDYLHLNSGIKYDPEIISVFFDCIDEIKNAEK